MSETNGLTPITPQPGKPLYLVAKDHLRQAIDGGVFAAGQQMPSTKELSETLSVSLVTAHRALQELVNAGVLERSQGKGTFVHASYEQGRKTVSDLRIAVLLNRDASLADHVYGQIVEGIRQGAYVTDADLIFPRFDEDVRKECHGVILVCPMAADVEAAFSRRGRRVISVGSNIRIPDMCSIYVDNVQVARQAVAHLTGVGHTQIGFVGAADGSPETRDRWQGYLEGLADRGVGLRDQWAVRSEGWRLSDRERNDLMRLLSSPARPTALLAAGYYYALDVYAAAQTMGLRIGHDLSVMAIDDPPSAAYLSPALTTVRQPLLQLGHGAVTTLVESLRTGEIRPENRVLRAELIVRESTAPVRG